MRVRLSFYPCSAVLVHVGTVDGRSTTRCLKVDVSMFPRVGSILETASHASRLRASLAVLLGEALTVLEQMDKISAFLYFLPCLTSTLSIYDLFSREGIHPISPM